MASTGKKLPDQGGAVGHIVADLVAIDVLQVEFANRYERLLSDYPGEWIVFYDGSVQAHNKSFDSVQAEADKMNIPRNRRMITYMDPEPLTLILHADRALSRI